MNTDYTDMVQAGFDALLQHKGGTRLKSLGYAYDDRLRLGDELSGFSKRLDDNVFAIVQFQRHAHATASEFTINLLRVKAAELEPRVYDGYDGARGARLSHVLWFAHNVRIYPQPDYWWAATEIEVALDALMAYGLPWLEDPHSPKPWEMPLHRGHEFLSEIQAIVVPELRSLGFRAEVQTLAGGSPYPYFVKPLSAGEFALIEFQANYSLDPERFQFDVRLQRKATDDPLDFDGHYHQWRTASLGQLVWREHHGNAALTVETAHTLFWYYTARADLEERLREVLIHLKRLGLPWLASEA